MTIFEFNLSQNFMKMFRLLFVLLCLSPLMTQAQKSKPVWFVKAAVGFGTRGFLPQEFTVKSIYPSNTSLSITDGPVQDMTNNIDSVGQRTLVRDTYAKGFNYFVSGGVKFNSRLGLELGLLWLQGGDITSQSVIEGNVLLGKGARMSINTYSRGLAILPAATCDFPLGPKWFIQGRIGLTIPIAGAIYHQVSLEGPNALIGAAKAEIEAKTIASFSLGINGGLGIHRRLGKYLEVFAGISSQHMNLLGKSLTVTKYDLTIGGITINQLAGPTAKVYDSQLNFVDEINQTSNNKASNPNTDLTKPKEELRVSSPFSSIGFGFGIVLNFPGKE